nr:type II toxin-antitoxin system Phd/YefM family antitoxin [Actinomycetales bacterium]
MKRVTVSVVRANFDALLAELESSRDPVTITDHGRPVAVLSAATPSARAECPIAD